MPRAGFLSPSSFADLMSNERGTASPGKTAMKVIDLLTLDLLGVERKENGTPISCQWGIDHEEEAILAYEDDTFREVLRPVEFRVSPTHSYVGGTMDGLVGAVGGVEVKCPYNSAEHLDNIRAARQFKTTYKYQLQGYFWIYELKWIDCISYDPRFPEPQQLAIYRAYPDETIIRTLKERCELAYRMAQENAGRLS